jgi:hypothetical protein
VPASSLEKHINLLCLCNLLKSDGSIQYLNPKPITACFSSHLNYCCIVIFTRFIILQMILLPPSLPHDLLILFSQWVATELHETLQKHPKRAMLGPLFRLVFLCPGWFYTSLSFSTESHEPHMVLQAEQKKWISFSPPHVLQSHNKFKPITFQKRGQEFYW